MANSPDDHDIADDTSLSLECLTDCTGARMAEGGKPAESAEEDSIFSEDEAIGEISSHLLFSGVVL